MSSAISSVTSTSTTGTANDGTTIPVPTQGLSQQDFLKLLVSQMTSQDPLNPTNSQDLLSQMTQFSTLNANTSMQTQLANMQTSQQFATANSLLGKQVSLQVDAKTIGQGVVAGVDTSSNPPRIIVDGQSYGLSQVLSITNPTTTTP